MHNAYPVMLKLAGKACLVVGGGSVAARKVCGLLDAGADVTVVSPTLNPALQAQYEAGRFQWYEGDFHAAWLTEIKPLLVFAATDAAAVNREVAQAAEACGVLVNVVDGSADDTFDNMLASHRPPLTVSVSTGGASPSLAKRLLAQIDATIGDEYVTLARWLADLRPVVRENVEPQSRRRDLYHDILDSDVLPTLRTGDADAAKRHMQTLLTAWGVRS